jgi:hypothetical protein
MIQDSGKLWLDENGVTCNVFRGRWSVRNCFRIYNNIKILRFSMSSRNAGKVTRHQSAYNPCEKCSVMLKHIADGDPYLVTESRRQPNIME